MTSQTPILDSLAQVFAARQRQLYIAALAITRNRASAEDAIFEAMLAISQLPHTPDDLPAYLFRTVRNKALHSNKRAERLVADEAIGDFLDTQTQTSEEQVFVRQVLRLLDSLDPDQQQVLIMKLFGDLTFAEIAEITVSNPNTVASWYRRGLQLLKEKIHEPAF